MQGILSTPHKKKKDGGKTRDSGITRQIRLAQAQGCNLLPVKSGIYKVRIEVRNVQTRNKHPKRDILIILKDCVNGVVLE